jgi:hypothetical protein
MKNHLILCLSFFLLTISCEKKKIERIENKLVGSWELEESKIGDKETDLTDRKIILTFFENDPIYAEYGGHLGEMYQTHGNYTYSVKFQYQVVSRKKDLELSIESTSVNNFEAGYLMSLVSIAKIKNNKLTIEAVNGEGVETVLKYKRIK